VIKSDSMSGPSQRPLFAALAFAVGGCAWLGIGGGKSSTPPPEAPLVIFTADSDATKNPGLSQVADALNTALRGSFTDAKASRISPVNIADARAVVEECNLGGKDNSRCWTTLASLNHAHQIVVPDLVSERRGAVTVTVTFYDADAQKVVRTATDSFKNADEACAGVSKIVADVAPPKGG
jgi:hypothetical protein